MLVTWKLRDSPRRLISQGDMAVISLPLRAIEPASGFIRPLMRLNSVDLPAPLGPITAWRSHAVVERVAPRMISGGPETFRIAHRLEAGPAIPPGPCGGPRA